MEARVKLTGIAALAAASVVKDRISAVICMAVCVGVPVCIPALATTPTCSVDRYVAAAEFHRQSRLEALLQLGRENGISFGMETPDNLREPVSVSYPKEKLSAAVTTILGSTTRYRLSCVEGAVLIRDTKHPGPSWLSLKVPEFKIPAMGFGMASFALSMRVDVLLNPRLQGFAGSILGKDPAGQVGPMDIRGATVRTLLCKLVGSSHAMWIAGDPGQFSGTDRPFELWTMAPYPNADHR